VTERARIGGQSLGSAERREQQVAGGVVAHDHGRFTKLRERHALAAGTVLGDGGIHDHVARLEPDATVEIFVAGVDAREDGGGGQQLERAAHGKALVGAMPRCGLRGGIAHGDAQPPAALRFDLRELGREPLRQAVGACREGHERNAGARQRGACVVDQSTSRDHAFVAPGAGCHRSTETRRPIA
jgi:hypothetical protein